MGGLPLETGQMIALPQKNDMGRFTMQELFT
jgi:hypothetical protein